MPFEPPRSRNRTPASEPYTSATGSERRRVPAWLMSGVLHGVILVLLALISPVREGRVGAEPTRRAAITLVQQSGSAVEYFSEESDAAATDATSATTEDDSSSQNAALPSVEDLSLDLSGLLPDANERNTAGLGAAITDALPGAGQLTAGAGTSKKIGNSAKTYVFGVEGEGSVFLYVFDRSESMKGYQGRPLAAAKSELIKSLRALDSIHQFQIIFYNDRVSAFNPFEPQRARLMFADETNKQLAEDFVRQTSAAGGTRHMEPLRLALRLAPDVVFFLTDAAYPQLSAAELDELRRSNAGTVINTIEFGAGPLPGGDNFLKRLARQNDGQHVYVDVTKLPARTTVE